MRKRERDRERERKRERRGEGGEGERGSDRDREMKRGGDREIKSWRVCACVQVCAYILEYMYMCIST